MTDMSSLTPHKLALIAAFEAGATDAQLRELAIPIHGKHLAYRLPDIRASVSLLRAWMWRDAWAAFPLGKQQLASRIDQLVAKRAELERRVLELTKEINKLAMH